MTRGLIIGIICILIGYGLVEARPVIAGPALLITSPHDGESFKDAIVSVSGRAARTAELMLNGNILLREEDGDFSSQIALPHGISILTFQATDRFGKQAIATRTIFIP